MTPPGVDECFVHDFCVQPIIQDTGELEKRLVALVAYLEDEQTA